MNSIILASISIFLLLIIGYVILNDLKKEEKKEGISYKDIQKNFKKSTSENIKETTYSHVPSLKVKPLDFSKLKTNYGIESAEEMEEFINDLKNALKNNMKKIEEYINENNWDSLKKQIHNLKGMAVNMAEGGVAELLYHFHDYLAKKESQNFKNIELKVVKQYYEDLKYYTDELLKGKFKM